MPFQPVDDTCQVTFQFTRDGVDHHPQFEVYFGKSGGWSGVDLDALCQFYADGWSPTWTLDQYMGTADTLVRVSARDLADEFGNVGETIADVAGTSTNDMASLNNCALQEYRGATGTAPRRGGIYWPFIREGDLDPDGGLSTFITSDLNGDLSTMLTASLTAASPYSQVIVSRYHKTVGGTPPYYRDPALTKAVTTRTMRTIVASQRGRRDRP